MLDYIEEKRAVFVTNAVAHAQRLASKGMKVLLVGGELKATTEAVIGTQAMRMIQGYHFTKGFFGTNGVTRECGCTTPDANEAMVKQTAVEHCKNCYVVCDSSKFDQVSSVTFAPFSSSVYITEQSAAGYETCDNILVV